MCIVTLLNLFVEYIMGNAGLDESQDGIKIARRNINNLRHADDTTLMAEVKSLSRVCNPMDCSLPGSSVMGFSSNSTRVGCHFLLQGIFLTQVLSLGLLHCRQTIYHLSHQGSPNGETGIKNRLMNMGRGEERVRCMERVIWKFILPYVK